MRRLLAHPKAIHLVDLALLLFVLWALLGARQEW